MIEMHISSRNMGLESAAMKVMAKHCVGEGAAELGGMWLGAGSSSTPQHNVLLACIIAPALCT